MPLLGEETGNILECFLLCKTQLRATSAGAYALDWGIIAEVAQSLSIPTDGPFYRMLAAYEAVLIEEMNSKT